MAQAGGWEGTEYLQLLDAVAFLRAAPNMSQGPVLDPQVSVGKLLDTCEELGGSVVLALLLLSSCHFN